MPRVRHLVIFILAALLAFSAFGQGTTGTIVGTATTDGQPLPGVTVTISSPSLQGARMAVTGEGGGFTFPSIPPGHYAVSFELAGMGKVTRNVTVQLASTSRADADLRMSAVAEAITVTAAAPAVLETTDVARNYTAEQVSELPVRRNITDTVLITPGVNQAGARGNIVISGAASYDNLFLVNGVVVNENLRGQPHNLFIEDAIQETTVFTGSVSAEYGRFTGGVVSAITKSGGNEFNGSLRDNVNNPEWTAQGELNEPRPESDLVHTFEGTLGGYVVRDRLWFFTAGRTFDYGAERTLATLGSGEIPTTYPATEEETRIEAKLTGQITPRHTLAGTYFDIDRKQFNPVELGGNPLYLEEKSLGGNRELPNRFITANYNGIITDNLLIEGLYAKQDFSFIGAGADVPATPERGTNVFLQGFDGAIIGYPTFCGSCSFPEERNNNNGKLKGSYFLSSAGLGTHNVSVGYEFYEDILKSDNHQSSSDFTLYTYDTSLADNHAAEGAYVSRGPNGEILTSLVNGGAFIIYWPILESAKGNSFKTNSYFVNDKWDLNEKLSFNLGVRYDQNKGKDNAGAAVADDSNISPRLGMTYDIFGNGRVRANASYSTYASKIANGNVGDAASPAGSPSILYWIYYGPDLNNVNSDQLLDGVFSWFNSVGGAANRGSFFTGEGYLIGGGSGGISTQIRESLQTPTMREFTVGLGTQVGTNGFVRVDYQDREWDNYYASEASQEIGQVFDPLAGGDADLTLVTNSEDFTRNYRAVLLQGTYRLFNRLNIGGNYTWSKLEGNITGETGGSGPVTGAGENYYREFLGYANNNPIGLLPQDQTHKFRAWASFDIPTPVGTFNLSALQRFDSGTAYSAIGTINPSTFVDNTALDHPYVSPPTSANYYFGKRGAYRTDDVTATDLALNYNLPISRINLFFQGEVINALNAQAVVTPNQTVSVVRAVNPFSGTFTECPAGTTSTDCRAMFPDTSVGIFRKDVNFGKGISSTTGSSLLPGGLAGSFQLPRTYRFSFGVRF